MKFNFAIKALSALSLSFFGFSSCAFLDFYGDRAVSEEHIRISALKDESHGIPERAITMENMSVVFLGSNETKLIPGSVMENARRAVLRNLENTESVKKIYAVDEVLGKLTKDEKIAFGRLLDIYFNLSVVDRVLSRDITKTVGVDYAVTLTVDETPAVNGQIYLKLNLIQLESASVVWSGIDLVEAGPESVGEVVPETVDLIASILAKRLTKSPYIKRFERLSRL